MFPPLRLREAMSLGGMSVRELAVRTWKKMNDHEILTRASAVAFYAMLAMVPFLAFLLTLLVELLPDVTGRTGERGIGNMSVAEFRETMRHLVPAEASKVIEEQIARIQKEPPVGLLGLGIAVSLWLASTLFIAVIDAMNRIYGVRETRPYWKLRLLAMIMTVVQAVFLVGSLLAIVVWPEFIAWLGYSGSTVALTTAVQWLIVLALILFSFALAFYVAPDADQRWEWITPGSIAGTFAFLLVSLLFRIYVQRFGNYDKTYGSLGGVMILMFWFWLTSVILLASAQVNKVIEDASPLGKSFGQRHEPGEVPDFQQVAGAPPPPTLPEPRPASG